MTFVAQVEITVLRLEGFGQLRDSIGGCFVLARIGTKLYGRSRLIADGAESFDLTLTFSENIRASDLMLVTVTLKSTLGEDSFRSSGLSARIFRRGERTPIREIPLRAVGPRPGPHDTSDPQTRPIPLGGVVEHLRFFAGAAGTYDIEVEYLTEIGLRASRRTTYRVMPAGREPSPATKEALKEIVR